MLDYICKFEGESIDRVDRIWNAIISTGISQRNFPVDDHYRTMFVWQAMVQGDDSISSGKRRLSIRDSELKEFMIVNSMYESSYKSLRSVFQTAAVAISELSRV